jgi:hypothetical protein
MAKKEFKFLEAYRIAAPVAVRDVVEARQKAEPLYMLNLRGFLARALSVATTI